MNATDQNQPDDKKHQATFDSLLKNAMFLVTFGLVVVLISFSGDELLISDSRLVKTLIFGDTSLILFLFIAPVLTLGLAIYVGILFYAVISGQDGRFAAAFAVPNINNLYHRRVLTAVCWTAVYALFPVILGCIAFKIAAINLGIFWCLAVALGWVAFHCWSVAVTIPTRVGALRWVGWLAIGSFAAAMLLALCYPTRPLSLVGVGLAGSVLNGIHLEDADLVDADFSDALLRCAVLDGVAANFARFDRAKMHEASVIGATLTDASFDFADLTGAKFMGATVDRASFKCARVSSAVFDHESLPDLSVACFVDADEPAPKGYKPSSYKLPDCCLQDFRPTPPCP